MAQRDHALFEGLAEQRGPARVFGAPRLSSPQRDQVSWQPLALDDLLPAGRIRSGRSSRGSSWAR